MASFAGVWLAARWWARMQDSWDPSVMWDDGSWVAAEMAVVFRGGSPQFCLTGLLRLEAGCPDLSRGSVDKAEERPGLPEGR